MIIVKDWLCAFSKHIEFEKDEKDSISKLKSCANACEDNG